MPSPYGVARVRNSYLGIELLIRFSSISVIYLNSKCWIMRIAPNCKPSFAMKLKLKLNMSLPAPTAGIELNEPFAIGNRISFPAWIVLIKISLCISGVSSLTKLNLQSTISVITT